MNWYDVKESNFILDTLDVEYFNMGYDFLAEERTAEDSMRFLDISGNKKYFLKILAVINRKTVLPFVTYSSSSALQYIDEYLDLDQTAATLEIQVDGHDSQFEEILINKSNGGK